MIFVLSPQHTLSPPSVVNLLSSSTLLSLCQFFFTLICILLFLCISPTTHLLKSLFPSLHSCLFYPCLSLVSAQSLLYIKRKKNPSLLIVLASFCPSSPSFFFNPWSPSFFSPSSTLVSPPHSLLTWLPLTFEGERGSTQLTKREAVTSQQTWYTSICSGLKIHPTGHTQSVCSCTQHLFPPPRSAEMAQLLHNWGSWARWVTCCWPTTEQPRCVEIKDTRWIRVEVWGYKQR